jgi:hypothetical protein
MKLMNIEEETAKRTTQLSAKLKKPPAIIRRGPGEKQ